MHSKFPSQRCYISSLFAFARFLLLTVLTIFFSIAFLLYLCPDLYFLLQLKFFTTLGWSPFQRMLSSYFKTVNSPEMEPKRLITNNYYSHTTIPLYLNKKDKGHMENVSYQDDRPANFNNDGQIQCLAVTGGPCNQVYITGYPYEDGYVLN